MKKLILISLLACLLSLMLASISFAQEQSAEQQATTVKAESSLDAWLNVELEKFKKDVEGEGLYAK